MPGEEKTETPESTSKKCGFCQQEFPSVQALYEHQMREHDPDGIMFSEIGLPK